jgi:HSP20 family protein
MSARSTRSPRDAAPASPWDPIRDLIGLRDRTNRLLETVLRRGELPGGEVAGWTPAADLREDHEGYLLMVELPGVRKEDIRIRIEGGLLTLEGVRPVDPQTRDADHLRVERSHGPFARAFHIIAPIDARRVTARYDRGVLEVFLPKSSESRSRPVSVRVV